MEKVKIVPFTAKYITDKNYYVIGDTHGCFDEFIAALQSLKWLVIEDGIIKITDPKQAAPIILVGDYVDKGPKVREIVEFLYNNFDKFIVVVGNHEWWDILYLNGDLKATKETASMIDQWFTSVPLFQGDEALKDKFFYMFRRSYHSVITPSAVITHAPCKNEFLFRTDNPALKHQRNMSYPKDRQYKNRWDYLNARHKFFEFLLLEASDSEPYHIFGHTMLPKAFKYKNKIAIDTGCVAGNELTMLYVKDGDLVFNTFDSFQPKKQTLDNYFLPHRKLITICKRNFNGLKQKLSLAAKPL